MLASLSRVEQTHQTTIYMATSMMHRRTVTPSREQNLTGSSKSGSENRGAATVVDGSVVHLPKPVPVDHDVGLVQHVISRDKQKREIKNEREKQRASQISRQISDLKDLLVQSGVAITPDATKIDVLSETTSRIRALQNSQQMQRQNFSTGLGILVPSDALRGLDPLVATHIPSRELRVEQELTRQGTIASTEAQPYVNLVGKISSTANTVSAPTVPQGNDQQVTTTDREAAALDLAISASLANQREANPNDYKLMFEACPFPMAIANLGGKFLDCNKSFRRATGYTNDELQSMTLFSLIHQKDLSKAFDSLSRMIANPLAAAPPATIVDETPAATFEVVGTIPVSTNKRLQIQSAVNEQGNLCCLCLSFIGKGEQRWDKG